MTRVVKALIAALVLVAIVIAAVPWWLSSERVKTRIERQLSNITGRPVRLKGGSSLTLNPYLGVSYSDVTVGSTDEGTPLLMMDGLKARVGLLSALRGKARLSQVQLIRPTLNLIIAGDGKRNWTAQSGPIGRRMGISTGVESQSLQLSDLQIDQGKVTFTDERSGYRESARDVTGTISWPDAQSTAEADLTFLWRDEQIAATASSDNLVELLKGGVSPVAFNVRSKPLVVSYSGELDTRTQAIANGTLTAKSSAPSRLSSWLRQPIGTANLLDEFSMSGEAVIEAQRLTLNDVSATVNSQPATGRLQFVRGGDAKLGVVGTLAFETLKLLSPLSLVQTDFAQRTGGGNWLNETDFDLRLSASEATSGSLTLANMAGTVQIKDGVANFDIGRANALGGVVSGNLQIASLTDANLSSLVLLNDIDLERLSDFSQNPQLVLQGKGNVSLKLKVDAEREDSMLLHLNGDGKISASNGTFSGINMAALVDPSAGDAPIRSKEIFSGETPFSSLDMEFFIANGVAFLKETSIEFGTYTVSLSGRSDISNQALAIRGRAKVPQIDISSAGLSKVLHLPFFVGGTLAKPLFISLPKSTVNISRESAEPASDN